MVMPHVESYDKYLTTSDAIIAHDCRLTDLTVTGATLSGSWMPANPEAKVERVTHAGTEMDIQLQAKDGGYLKCVHVVLRQQGADVVARADWVACASANHGFGYDLSKECNRERFEGLRVATGPNGDESTGYGVAKICFKRSPAFEIETQVNACSPDQPILQFVLRPLVNVPSDEIRAGLHWTHGDDSWGGFIVDKVPRELDDGRFLVDYTLGEIVQRVSQETECPFRFTLVVFFTQDGSYDNAYFKTELGFSVAKHLIVQLNGPALEYLKTAFGALKSGYRVIQLLGKGAMGEVWEVEDMSLRGPHLAMKVFNPIDLTCLAGLRERFAREARVMHEISHDVLRLSVRLPRIHRYVQDPQIGNPFYVMDLIVGPRGKPCNLGEMWKDGYADMFDEEHVAEWFEDVCRALMVLHGHHCLHRDIKPENILVDSDGHAVLVDFGTANIFSEDFSKDERNNITLVGVFAREQVGTRKYWAPELQNGKSATEASDIYALAVTFWNLLFNEMFGQEDYPPEQEKFSDWGEEGARWLETLKLMLSPKPGDRPASVHECLRIFKGAKA